MSEGCRSVGYYCRLLLASLEGARREKYVREKEDWAGTYAGTQRLLNRRSDSLSAVLQFTPVTVSRCCTHSGPMWQSPHRLQPLPSVREREITGHSAPLISR